MRVNVRGICCLRPGLKGVSDTIDVVPVEDRFLAHARVLYVRNRGDEEVYLASADWMGRNLDNRIELLFPIESPEHRQRVQFALDAAFQDNVKGRWLQSDGTYKRRRLGKGDEPFRMQLVLYREAKAAVERARATSTVALEPLMSPGS